MLTEKYPHLLQEVTWPWGPTRASFVLLDEAPPGDEIANVNIVPRTRDGWAILKLVGGSWDIPGGTLEPGESYIDAIRRELLEEAGAELLSFHIIGAWRCISLAEKPYRPHLPHPNYYRVAGVGEIKIVALPSNPTGGEQVSRVEIVSLETAVERFVSINRYDLAELYQLGASKFY